MMKPLICIITYNRPHAVSNMLNSIKALPYPVVVFDDCSTVAQFKELREGRTKPRHHLKIEADIYDGVSGMPNVSIALGRRNLGVAGNSNRAIRMFAENDYTHLFLCNDDLLATGDFVELYTKALEELKLGMLCYCGFEEEKYRYSVMKVGGWDVKFLTRITGSMIAVTRAVINKIGYFDPVFGKFGEEHVDFTHRARIAGFIRLGGSDFHCLDVKHNLLSQQMVDTCLTGKERAEADKFAADAMQQACAKYVTTSYHRPFRLDHPQIIGLNGIGVTANLALPQLELVHA